MKLIEILHTIQNQKSTDNIAVDNWMYPHVMYLNDLGFTEDVDHMYLDADKDSYSVDMQDDVYDNVKFPELKIYFKRGTNGCCYILVHKDKNNNDQVSTQTFHGEKSMHSDHGFNEMLKVIENIINKL